MSSTSDVGAHSKIDYFVGINLQGPIIPGDYVVGDATINVSYPAQIDLGLPTPIKLPMGASTLFIVSWVDKTGKTASQIAGKSFERHLAVHRALDLISQFLLGFKLVRVGHADGLGIRTVGIADTLFHFCTVNGASAGNLNLGLRLDKREYPWRAVGEHPFDHSGTTKLALDHVNARSFPTARKYVRCFELLEHGYYSEALIVAHANLDDLVQEAIHDQLKSKGLDDDSARRMLLRSIKEARLQIYLGPLLKVLFGTTIEEIWTDAGPALNWLNQTRNKIAHQGLSASRDDACKAIFVCIKTIAALNKNGVVSADFPKGMFRHARVTAAWTSAPPSWVPAGDAIENDPFE